MVKNYIDMGLDNGIIIKEAEALKDEFKSCPCFTWSDDDQKTYGYQEIAYWRKCWGIREAILRVLRKDQNSCGEHLVEYDDVQAIVRALKPFLSKEYWEENADSIWEYESAVDNLIDTILRLSWLDGFMQTHKDLKVYFYDSY